MDWGLLVKCMSPHSSLEVLWDASDKAAEKQHGLDRGVTPAGAAFAVAVGLLLPSAQQQKAADERLQLLAELPGPADVSLIATLLARRLWPKAASSPAYPQLAQSLLEHGALATGDALSTHALRAASRLYICQLHKGASDFCARPVIAH